MKPLIIDTHCHLDDKRFDEDLHEVITRAHENGVRGVLIPGADIYDLPKAQKIAKNHENIFFAAGVHPYHHKDFNAQILEEYIGDEKCIAIGECGLDYYRLPQDEKEKSDEIAAQKEVFIAQIELARKYDKPLIVHIRDANEDSFEILNQYAVKYGVTGVLHCYNASRLLLGLKGFYFAVGGVLTFANAKELVEVLSDIPRERLLFETDAPYLTPVPHRGKRNEPAFTLHVLEKAAAILGSSVEDLAELSSKNTKNIFKAFNKAT